jgi:hypothetical protein
MESRRFQVVKKEGSEKMEKNGETAGLPAETLEDVLRRIDRNKKEAGDGVKENESEDHYYDDWTAILHHFGFEINSCVIDGPIPFLDFFLEEAKIKDQEDLDPFFEVARVAFGYGYVFGQMFDLCTEEGKRAVENLKKRIIEEGLVLFRPRENKPSAKIEKC